MGPPSFTGHNLATDRLPMLLEPAETYPDPGSSLSNSLGPVAEQAWRICLFWEGRRICQNMAGTTAIIAMKNKSLAAKRSIRTLDISASSWWSRWKATVQQPADRATCSDPQTPTAGQHV